MLKKLFCLNKDKEFKNVFKSGFSSYNKIIGIKAVKNNLKFNRFGVIVGSKVSKKAVVRNKIKRRIKEVLRANLEKMKPGYDIVLIALPEVVGKQFQEIKKSIFNNFKKLNLLIK